MRDFIERPAFTHRYALAVYAAFIFVIYLSLIFYKQFSSGVLGYASNIYTEEIVSLTNAEREKNGLPKLMSDAKLSVAAQTKAEDMFERDYWAHVSPQGKQPWDFIVMSGYDYLYAGENLAKDFQNSDGVVAAWMASPSHRQNVLNSRYKDIGVAVVNGELDGVETTLVVQLFGERSAPPLSKEVALSLPKEAVSSEALGSLSVSSPIRVDIFRLSRSLAFAVSLLLLIFFSFDEIAAWRKGHVRLSGHALAHISLLLFLLGVVWLTRPGVVL